MVGVCFFAPLALTDTALYALAVSEGVFECFGDGERERINKISNPVGKALSLGGLIALRRAVSGFAPVEQPLTISRDKFGKPRFVCGDAEFSIAHAGGLSVAAISHGSIGVDIERIDSGRDTDRIAKRFFSEGEQKRLAAADDRLREFYRIWTAKEAMMKRGGEGMLSIMTSDSARAEASGECAFARYEIAFGDEVYILTVCTQSAEQIELRLCEGVSVL